MEWTDTTEYRLTADAFPGSERAVTTYHATANDAPGMRKGITLQSYGLVRPHRHADAGRPGARR